MQTIFYHITEVNRLKTMVGSVGYLITLVNYNML